MSSQYEDRIYDGLQGYLPFTFKYKNLGGGSISTYNANYWDAGNPYKNTINSISDSVSSHLAKQSLLMNKFAVQELVETEEVLLKQSEPATVVIYGLENTGTGYERVKILSLELFPINRNIYGRPTLYIGDTYYSGKTVEDDLEDELETSPSTLSRQVIRIEWDDRTGFRYMEYAGTPRQICHWLLGGLPFAKDVFDYDSIEAERSAIEAEKTNYDDGRSKPGDLWNSDWASNYSNIDKLEELTIEFIDSNNSTYWTMLKAIAGNLNVLQNRVSRLFNKYLIRAYDEKDTSYWLDVLGTKIYRYKKFLDLSSTITSIDYDDFYNIKSITLDSTTGWPQFAFFSNGTEICQYREKKDSTIYDIDRQLRGTRKTFAIGDTLRVVGSAIFEENLESLKDRESTLLGPKETQQSLEDALNVLMGNSENATASVFDFHCEDYQDYDLRLDAWAYPRRDIGWLIGSEGFVSFDGAWGDYDASEQTITVYEITKWPVKWIATGDIFSVNTDGHTWTNSIVESVWVNHAYEGDKAAYDDGLTLSKPIYGIITLTDALTDIDDLTGVRIKSYAVGSETNKIRSSTTTGKLNFAPQTLVGKYLETSGYFTKTQILTDIIYETDNNIGASTLSEAVNGNGGSIPGEDTRIYGNTSDMDAHPRLTGKDNSRYSYTGRVLHYEVEDYENNPLEGKYPFIVVVNDWEFNDCVIVDTVNRLKAVGTTANYAINKTAKRFNTMIGSDKTPFINFTFVYSNT